MKKFFYLLFLALTLVMWSCGSPSGPSGSGDSGSGSGTTGPFTLTVSEDSHSSFGIYPLLADYESGSSVTLNGSFDAGYELASWTDTGSGQLLSMDNPYIFNINENREISLASKVTTSTLDIIEENCSVSRDNDPDVNGEYDYDEAVELTVTPDGGYTFARWEGDLSGNTNPVTVNMTDDMVITAICLDASSTCDVTLDIQPASSGTVNRGSGIYERDRVFSFEAEPAAGYLFKDWNGTVTANPTNFTFTSATETITANFEKLYQIDRTSDHGYILLDPDKEWYSEGETVDVSIEADEGYAFDIWSGGTLSGSTASQSFTMPASDVDLTASYEKLYQINLNQPEGGTISLNPDQDWYALGDVVEVTMNTEDSHVFDGWNGALSSMGLTESVTMGSADITIGAEMIERWLILVHFAIDNNIDYSFEENYGLMTDYLNTLEEIEASDTRDVVDILVMMDSYDTTDPWGTGYTSAFTDGYYELTGLDLLGGDEFNDDRVVTTGEINSGSVAVTKSFMNWAVQNYGGEQVFYSVFNHGGGFDDQNVTATRGIGFDDSHDGDALSHNELAQATAYLKNLTGDKIDLFYTYACLMGGVELAYEVRDNADLLLFSEEVFPAEEWSYEALSNIISDPYITPENLAKGFCDSAYTYFSNPTMDRGFTLASVDLTKIEALYNAIDSFADQAVSWIGNDSTRAGTLNDVAEAGLAMETSYYTDLGIFMDGAGTAVPSLSTYSDAVETALNEAVLYKRVFGASYQQGTPDLDDASGMSIFHNLWVSQATLSDYENSIYTTILAFGNNGWADYMQKMYDLTVLPQVGPAPDSYEPDDSTVPILSMGSANRQYHTFHNTGVDRDNDGYVDVDEDVMAVNLVAGEDYIFETSAATQFCDTYMLLVNSSNNAVAGNDDIDYMGGNYYSRITYTPLVSGYYYLFVSDAYLQYGDYYVSYDESTLSMPVQPEGNKTPVYDMPTEWDF